MEAHGKMDLENEITDPEPKDVKNGRADATSLPRIRDPDQVRAGRFQRIRNAGLGLLFVWMLFVSSFLGVTFFNPFFLPLLFVGQTRLYRMAVDPLVSSWFIYCQSLMELILGIRFVITGDKIRSNESNLIMMNHRTRLDWMYFWSVLVRQSGVTTEKIILKSPLKHVPGGGWAMQVGCFMFIRRRLEDDRKILFKMIDYFSDLRYKMQLLLFPEGTDLTQQNRTRSDAFAKKNNLAVYEYVLHPRTAGFTLITEHMRQNNALEAIYDVTIAYPYNIPQSEPDLVLGNIPREVHFHVQRHPVATLPDSEQGLTDWCNQRWVAKEELLRRFYQEKKFDSPDGTTEDEAASAERDESSAKLTLKIAFVYWTCFVLGIFFLLWTSWLTRCFVSLQIIFFVAMGYRGGFELFQADYFNRYFNQRKRE